MALIQAGKLTNCMETGNIFATDELCPRLLLSYQGIIDTAHIIPGDFCDDC